MALGIFTCACGTAAPPMQIGARCQRGDLRLEVEEGVPLPGCNELLAITVAYREAYEAEFGHLDLSGVRVRFRASVFVMDGGFTGHTYSDAIDIGQHQWQDVPHELNHVRTGPGHDGWCLDYEPWSEAVLGIDQRAYLGCP